MSWREVGSIELSNSWNLSFSSAETATTLACRGCEAADTIEMARSTRSTIVKQKCCILDILDLELLLSDVSLSAERAGWAVIKLACFSGSGIFAALAGAILETSDHVVLARSLERWVGG